MEPLNVLIVDPNPAELKGLSYKLANAEPRYYFAGSDEMAFSLLDTISFQVIVYHTQTPDDFLAIQKISEFPLSASAAILVYGTNIDTILPPPETERISYIDQVELFPRLELIFSQNKATESPQVEPPENRDQFLAGVFESINASVVVLDANLTYRYVNQALLDLLKKDRPEIIGRPFKSPLEDYPNFTQLWLPRLRQVIGSKKPIILEDAMEIGSRFVISESRIMPITDQSNQVLAVIILYRDITDRKMAERELVLAKEAAEKANQAKSAFLANMSHDIRTPMNVILGMADLLSETPLNAEQKNYIKIFRSAGQNLLALINDILDLSKIEKDGIQLEEAAINPIELLETTCELFAIDAQEKGLELICHIHPRVPKAIYGDYGRLRQILVNLIGNAVKFTREGEILVSLRPGEITVTDDQAGKVQLVLSVKDTGIGIPVDKTQSIFTRFVQGDSSTTREFGGTGLGLTICRKLANLVDGSIVVKSEPDTGSEFSFIWSCRPEEMVEISEDIHPAFAGVKILIIDTNQAVTSTLRETLTDWGFTVKTAISDLEAHEELTLAIEANKPFRVILCDAKLATSDYLDVFSFQTSSLTDVFVMATTIGRAQDSELMKKTARDHTITKPLKQKELKTRLLQILSIQPQAVASSENQLTSATSTQDNSKTMKILLVDDSADNCLLIKAFLKKTPHQLTIAENGEIGLEKFKEDEFDLVLMDMHMPIKDGYHATSEIREWEEENQRSRTRIIALTANAMREDAQASFDAGCDDHLTKPITKKKLLETLAEHEGENG